MKPTWRQTVFPIAAIFSFRLLGLFMLIPIFTLHTSELSHATPLLIGIALGSYGLSQGILQIPFGWLSDRWGRKSMITIGLILFAIGSLMGALAHSIELMIAARILQGSGAIGSVLMALLADLTPDDQRTKAMAVVGVTIGISFSLAMILSPVIAEYTGLSGIFYVTAGLALFAILLLHGVIPSPQSSPFHQKEIIRPQYFMSVLQNRHLQRLNAGIFFQHLMLTSTFYVIPLILKQHIQQGELSEPWQFYLPLMLIAFIVMTPVIVLAEKKQRMKDTFIFAVLLTACSQLALTKFYSNWGVTCGSMLTYFVAFNILEALLPSQISRQSGLHNKGTAMGIYSSSQFLGIFAGGTLAGLLFQYMGNSGIFLFNSGVALAWLWITFSMNPNAYHLTHTIPFMGPMETQSLIERQLQQLKGVTQVVIADQKIHLHLSKDLYVNGSAEEIVTTFSQNCV